MALPDIPLNLWTDFQAKLFGENADQVESAQNFREAAGDAIGQIPSDDRQFNGYWEEELARLQEEQQRRQEEEQRRLQEEANRAADAEEARRRQMLEEQDAAVAYRNAQVAAPPMPVDPDHPTGGFWDTANGMISDTFGPEQPAPTISYQDGGEPSDQGAWMPAETRPTPTPPAPAPEPSFLERANNLIAGAFDPERANALSAEASGQTPPPVPEEANRFSAEASGTAPGADEAGAASRQALDTGLDQAREAVRSGADAAGTAISENPLYQSAVRGGMPDVVQKARDADEVLREQSVGAYTRNLDEADRLRQEAEVAEGRRGPEDTQLPGMGAFAPREVGETYPTWAAQNPEKAARLQELQDESKNLVAGMSNPLESTPIAREAADAIKALRRAGASEDVIRSVQQHLTQGAEEAAPAARAAEAAPLEPTVFEPPREGPQPGDRVRLPDGTRAVVEETPGGNGAGMPPGPPTNGLPPEPSDIPPPPNPPAAPGVASRPGMPRQERAAELSTPIRLTDEEQVARIRLDKFPEEMRDDLLAAARATNFGERLRRGVLSDEAIQTLASEYAPSVDAAIRGARRGRAYNAEEIVGLRNLLVGQEAYVRSLADDIAARGLSVDEHTAALARLGIEQKKLAALGEVAFGGAPAEAGRALRQFRQMAHDLEVDPAGAGLRYIKQQFGSAEKAEEVAAKYRTMVEAGANPVQLADFLRSAKGGWLNRLNILRYAGMLSSPTTHLLNATGNFVLQGIDVATAPIAAGLDVARSAVTGAPRQVFFSELPARLHGMAAGAQPGMADAAFIMRHGFRPDDVTKLDYLSQGFGTNVPLVAPAGSRAAGAVDFFAEGPLRSLAAADAVFRGTAYGGHLAAEATATAMRENGGRAVTADAIREAMLRPEVIERAEQLAKRSVLQEDRAVTSALIAGIRRLPGEAQAVISTLVPFIKTPYNIIAQGAGMSPLGVLALIHDLHAGKPARQVEERLARMALGTAVMGVAAQQYLQGNLTGPRPERGSDISTLPPGWREWSWRVTGPDGRTRYVPLVLLGPLAVPAVVSILLAQAGKEGTKPTPEYLAEVALGVGRFASDQTFLQGLSQLAAAFSEGGNAAQNYVEQVATQFSPHIVGGGALGRQIQQVVGMPSRDPQGVIEALLATHPLTASRVPVRRDVLGRPVVTAPGGVESVVAPWRASIERDAPVIRAYRRAQVGLPRFAPNDAPDPSDAERRIPLTRYQKDRWKVAFGRSLQEEWQAAGMPADEDQLRQIALRARRAALEESLTR